MDFEYYTLSDMLRYIIKTTHGHNTNTFELQSGLPGSMYTLSLVVMFFFPHPPYLSLPPSLSLLFVVFWSSLVAVVVNTANIMSYEYSQTRRNRSYLKM